ncbi:MAG: T9SS type A sorting domain-containing protein [Bacteroidales bacterium]|nr:T9SS type A sorting domain-containing protein [Bacteroidales bacterium]MCF8389332.1 T9SS type A sorting domain-containing protein [Bacteroidales bacterium]
MNFCKKSFIIAFIVILFGANLFSQSALDINAYGVWCKGTDFDPADPNFDFLKGMSVEDAQWKLIQPVDSSSYDWSSIQQSIDIAAERGQFMYLGIGMGPDCPEWVYENGVPKVYTDDTMHPGWDYYPYYSDPDYVRYSDKFIEAFGEFLTSQPREKLKWVGFIQVKTGCTGDEVAYKGSPLDSQYDIPITGQKWLDFRLGVFEKYRVAFLTGDNKIPLMFNAIREEDYPIEWSWIINNIGSGFGIKEGALVRGHHLTGERIVVETWKPCLVNPKGLALFTRSEMDQTWKQALYQLNQELGFYWGIINGLNQGLSLNDVSVSAMTETENNISIQNTYRFFNKYADQIYPENSSKAFIAFHEGLDASDTNKFPESKYGAANQNNQSRYAAICNDPIYKARGARMDDLYGATLGQVRQRDTQTGYNDAGWEIWPGNYSRFLTQIDPEGTSIGLFRIGGTITTSSPIYSRFARSFENSTGKNAMYFQLDEDLFNNTPETVTFIVTYFDKTNGSGWSLKYDAGNPELKEAYTVTCKGSGTWKTQVVTVNDAVLDHNGPQGADFALINTDGKDDIFHMIQVEKGVASPIYKKSNNALLESICWPDIPDSLKNAEWNNLIIPGFKTDVLSYTIPVPYGFKQIPALTAKTQEINASLKTERATNLMGSAEERTTTFTVTAEDGKTKLSYKVLFEPENSVSLSSQPFQAEPLFTRLVYREWFNNNYIEISNPGTDTIDLSDYLIAIGDNKTPDQIISDTLTFDKRYKYYIPGCDYPAGDSATFVPGIVVADPDVESKIEPNGSFVIGMIEREDPLDNIHIDDCDIIMNKDLYFETDVKLLIPGINTIINDGWMTNSALCLYKILNDSIKNGTKAISDPDDFQLIDVFGTFDGSGWAPDGAALLDEDNKWNLTRKPEFWLGDTLPGLEGSWGANKSESEWICYSKEDYEALGMNAPESHFALSENIGSHTFDPVTEYISTISSIIYEVSLGHESPQIIEGIPFNTTLSGFLANIIKAHIDQDIVLEGIDGTIKAIDEIIIEGDTLTVTSSYGNNITKYGLNTSAVAQSDDAVLIAKDGSGYTIDYLDAKGTISGIPSGISISSILNNTILPENAILNVIDAENNLVPLLTLNSSGSYLPTTAGDSIFFEVIAEDNFTKISYQLQYILNENEAYVWSDVYNVDQERSIVTEISPAVNVSVLFKNLKPNIGSSIKLMDRAGIENLQGPVDPEDYVIVKSADGSKEKAYQLNFNGEDLGSEAFLRSDKYYINQESFLVDSVLIGTQAEELLDNINASPYASLELLDISMSPVFTGSLDENHTIHITSGDGETKNVYQISFYELGTEAFITSDIYRIYQETFIIDSIEMETSVSVFLANITAAPGASITILDANQNPVSSGNLAQGYSVKVISEDGLKELVYILSFYDPSLGINSEIKSVKLYPNPVGDLLSIEGLSPQSTINVMNIVGNLITSFTNENSEKLEVFTGNLDPGIYFIQLKNQDHNSVIFKIVKN